MGCDATDDASAYLEQLQAAADADLDTEQGVIAELQDEDSDSQVRVFIEGSLYRTQTYGDALDALEPPEDLAVVHGEFLAALRAVDAVYQAAASRVAQLGEGGLGRNLRA